MHHPGWTQQQWDEREEWLFSIAPENLQEKYRTYKNQNWRVYSLPFLEWLAWEGQQERWERERCRSDQTNPPDDAEAGRALNNAVERMSESIRDTEMALEVGAEHENEARHPEAPHHGIHLQGRAPLIHLPVVFIFVTTKKS